MTETRPGTDMDTRRPDRVTLPDDVSRPMRHTHARVLAAGRGAE